MNRSWCERESDAVQTVRTGLVSTELRNHVLSCAICAEAQAVAQAMLRINLILHQEHELPTAGLVWRRVEARKKEIILKRATRPLVFMRVLSVAYAVLSAAWFVHFLWRSGFMGGLSGWNGLLSETAGFAAVIAVLAIVIGAGCLLYDSRRSNQGVPSA